MTLGNENTDITPFNSQGKILSGENESREEIWSYLRQVTFCLIVSSTMIIMGFLVGSTTMLPKIMTDETNQNYTSEDLKFLASLPLLIQMPSNTVSFYLTEKFGPAYILRWCLLIALFCYLLMASWETLITLWISRVLLYAIYGVLMNIYVALNAEISEPNIRGLCGAFPGVIGSFGILFAYVTFSLMPGRVATVCNTVPVFFALVGSFFVPESPYWLIKNGRTTEAAHSIARIIGPVRRDKQESLFSETARIHLNNSVHDQYQKKPTIINQVKLLKKPKNFKSLLLVMSIYFFREFGGVSTIFHYILLVFQAANIHIDVFLCTIIGGVVRLVSATVSALILDKVGRRLVLIATTFASGVGLLLSGLILYFEISSLNVLALTAIMVFISAVSMGLGPMSYALGGELIPMEIKFLGNSISNSLLSLMRFTILCSIPILIRIIGINILFMVFGIVNFVACVSFYYLLPETNKKTLTQLQNLFH